MMSDTIDAFGGLADAALVATSLDTAGINAAVVAAHHQCANCGQMLTGHFCTNCGQKAYVHRSLLHVGEEFLHGITHFDGKAWRTLPMLLVRPGRLTRDYIMGKRARYIAPVPLFLLVVFLMFFVFSFVRIDLGGGATGANGKQLTKAEAAAQLPKIDAELRDLDRQIAVAKARKDTIELPGLEGARDGVVAARRAMRIRIDSGAEGEGTVSEQIRDVVTGDDFIVMEGSDSLNKKAKTAFKNPELLLYKIQGKAYKLSFLLVPMSLPWLWLMFALRRDVRMYDHAVFALYSISFMSLLFVIGSIAVTMGVSAGIFWFVLVCLAPVTHMFAQLKGAYVLSRFGAAWRTAALSFAAVITLSLYAVLMIVIGVLD